MKSMFSIKLLMMFSLCFGAVSLFAESKDEECSDEKLFSYFPKEFVMNALKKFQVPEDRWDSIYQDLSGKDEQIIKTVEEKASKMSPNPLHDPKERAAAVKIFRETIEQVFTKVMNANGISNDHEIKMMLDDIQKQKAELFAACMEKRRANGEEQEEEPGEESPEEDDDYRWNND